MLGGTEVLAEAIDRLLLEEVGGAAFQPFERPQSDLPTGGRLDELGNAWRPGTGCVTSGGEATAVLSEPRP